MIEDKGAGKMHRIENRKRDKACRKIKSIGKVGK
jgi:hypothetical protein